MQERLERIARESKYLVFKRSWVRVLRRDVPLMWKTEIPKEYEPTVFWNLVVDTILKMRGETTLAMIQTAAFLKKTELGQNQAIYECLYLTNRERFLEYLEIVGTAMNADRNMKAAGFQSVMDLGKGYTCVCKNMTDAGKAAMENFARYKGLADEKAKCPCKKLAKLGNNAILQFMQWTEGGLNQPPPPPVEDITQKMADLSTATEKKEAAVEETVATVVEETKESVAAPTVTVDTVLAGELIGVGK